jgi:scyllo-inositol 2-dehydrogenase (NADP+)
MSKGFYDNIYDVLVNKGKLVVKPSQVRLQIEAIQECHRQNPLPKKSKKKSASKKK